MLFLLPGTASSRRRVAEKLSQERPIVLMGRGHSGTRVLAWICAHLGIRLGTAEDLATGDAEDRRFTDAVKSLTARNLGVVRPGDVKRRDLEIFRREVFGYLERLPPPKQAWGWKFPETYLLAPYVERTFPKAIYLHLVRDGRDIAFKQHLTDNPRRKLGRRILASQQTLGAPRYIQAASSWAYQVDRFDTFRQDVPAERIFDVRFEDLCRHPAPTVEALTKALGVEMTPACERYIATEIRPEKVAQHREEDPARVREVEAAVQATLARYRYLEDENLKGGHLQDGGT